MPTPRQIITPHPDGAPLAEVDARLNAIEAEHGVAIVYACESGSRAWGFPSRDSDYDVRFIYVRPVAWYLTIDVETRRDVIETPIEGLWDVNGWDLRKALRLLRKSNPPLLEWLRSPIVYREVGHTAERIRAQLPAFFNPTAARYHYLHMAQRNNREYLAGERVRQKKYFYVLRPVLACRWLERCVGPVPMAFDRLLAATVDDDALLEAIEALVAQKRAGDELGEGPRIPVISDFLSAELTRLKGSGIQRHKPASAVDALSEVFRDSLAEVWGPSAGAPGR